MRPFSYLFNIFWSELQPVVVVGYSKPKFALPPNFKFHSVAPKNYPPDLWSNALIQFLRSVKDEVFCLMLEDYWLARLVNHQAIASLADFMLANQDVLRMDLTTDRLHAKGDARDAHDIGAWGYLDLILTDNSTPYNMSLQAGLWRRDLMLQVLEPGKSPWETEIHTSPPESMRVLGTRQWPLRYANAVYKGEIDMNAINQIPEPHRSEVLGWIPKTKVKA